MCALCALPVAGEMLSVAEHFLEQQMHPTIVISAYRQALEDMLNMLKETRYHTVINFSSGNIDMFVYPNLSVCWSFLV